MYKPTIIGTKLTNGLREKHQTGVGLNCLNRRYYSKSAPVSHRMKRGVAVLEELLRNKNRDD